ncbi:GDSL esterase/lipase At1g71250-like isoform X1 [Cucurbita maxima]|uniref:GDSL esterase/lipase At1g71250-like isoform X1 n=1 Tax=Cucurbita maxima TaxID=3661 RepID=A0A6J1K3Z0_CUCMA|nr:GDSL esterase/lipase At1g71250-like isoform X1 [Cucurbita maxima]
MHVVIKKLALGFNHMTLGVAMELRRAALFKSLFFTAYVTLIGLLGLSLAARGSSITAMYLLGDSSVDCGLNALFYPLLHRNFSITPCDSDGTTLLPHLLAEKMGVPHSQPWYNQNGSIEAILNGLSFGSPQATIVSGGQSHQSLNQQLRQVLDTLQLLRLQLGLDTARHFIQSSLFYFSFGEVDFILDSSRGKNNVKFAQLLASQMSVAIRNLHEAGAKKIVCMGILPLGCTPRVLSQWRDSPAAVYDEQGCVKEMNELVVNYNELMEKQIVMLNAQLGDARMVFCDAYKGMMEIISNPRRYGFEESRSACCGLGSYNASIGCVAKEIACGRVRRHVWWDLYNPTGAVNSLLANSAWRDRPFSNFCRPSTIGDLVK